MTTPTIYPVEFNPSVGDVFAKAPGNLSGAVQQVFTLVTVPTSTATTTVVGICPFRKGARMSYGSRLLMSDPDAGSNNVTVDWGYVYDDHATYTSDPDAFLAASTAPQTGAIIVPSLTAGLNWVAEADGWITITMGGATTGAEATIKSQLLISYDAMAAIA